MGFAAGGRLAAAVSAAGGLGLMTGSRSVVFVVKDGKAEASASGRFLRLPKESK